MRSICLYFQIHQPYRLQTYRFFDIGSNHHYYDEYLNKLIIKRVVEKSYIPMNKLLLDLIKEYGAAFKVSFSISGIAIDQLRQYAPEALESFKELAKTGNVEFLAETYAHSLVSLKDEEEFTYQVEKHAKTIEELFGKRPVTFRNTELIYSDNIGAKVLDLGFQMMLTEGAKHILGWKSPNYMYCNALNPKLKLLLRNFQLSDDIGFRFSNQSWIEWPLTAEKYANWISTFQNHQVVSIFLDYETFGEHQWAETGIFEFMRNMPKQVLSKTNFKFNTPSEIAVNLQPVSSVTVPTAISWADEERDLTAWLGNEMQDEAFDLLYSIKDKVRKSNDPAIQRDWLYLQTSDHFYYMCTKWFSDGAVHKYFNPYTTPYEAFINYMNVLNDFISRLETSCSDNSGKIETEKVVASTNQSPDFDVIFSLSKNELLKAINQLEIKELAYSLFDKAEDKIEELKKKLPLTYKKELEKVVSELKKPRKATIENYRKKVMDKLQSFLN